MIEELKDDLVFGPLVRYRLYLDDAARLVRVCNQGIIATLRAAQQNTEGKTAEDAYALTAEMRGVSALLFRHSLVGLWGALEASITDFVVAWVRRYPEALEHADFKRVKVDAVDFLKLDDQERATFLVKEVERTKGGQFKSGVTRFELLLDLIGLRAMVEPDLSLSLHEVSLLRNVIVHRASIADRRFVDACPSLKFTVGQLVEVSSDAWLKYLEAVTVYHGQVTGRALVQRDKLAT